MKRPNFFIVGAPKCGTTAMNDYLAKHPDVFMATKELHYFGSDLNIKSRMTLAEYLDHFDGVHKESVIGDASVWYLFSRTAAAEIKEFAPDAKILIMLRNPVQLIPSLHSQHLSDINEDVTDLEKALSLEEDRRSGKSLPDSLGFSALPSYIDTVMFADQVKRYFDIFGTANVQVLLYDDFARDPASAFATVLGFLGIENKIQIRFDVINPGKRIKNFRLHKLILRPSASLQKFARTIIPFKPVRHRLMAYLLRKNIEMKRVGEMSTGTRVKLKEFLAEDIRKLSKLLGRDLSAWL